MFKIIFTTIFITIVFSSLINAQYALGYRFFDFNYNPYQELTDAIISSATGDDGAENINLPFPFTYFGQVYTTARISVNGWLQMGQNYTGPGYQNNLASTETKPFICPLWDDLKSYSGSQIRYKTLGVEPARIFVVEWKNISAGGDRKSFQVKLYELDGTIEFHYGPQYGSGTGLSASIGLNDHIGGPGHFISITPGTFPTYDTLVANNQIHYFDGIPPDLQYFFIPIGRDFYITTYQITDNIIRGSSNQAIIAVLLTMRLGVLTPPSITAIDFNINGTSNTNDIVSAKLFTTGTSPHFNTNNQIGNTVISPSDSFTITGVGIIKDFATNYFWLTYDISDSAEVGNLVDAECKKVYFDLTFPLIPLITAPHGSRRIVGGSGLEGNYTIGKSGDFISITQVIDTLKKSFLKGNAIFEILNDYNSSLETYPINFGFISGSSENTMTIQPSLNTENVTISTNAPLTMKFDNSQNIKIDGRRGGVGDSISLSIENYNTTGSAINISGDSKNIEFKYCKIGGATLLPDKGVIEPAYSGFNTRSTNIAFRNCQIGKSNSYPKNLFYFRPFYSLTNDYWTISNCVLTDFTLSAITVLHAYRTLIEKNQIYLTTPSQSPKVVGISIDYPAWSLKVDKNKIYSLSSTAPDSNLIIGIEIPTGATHKIYNNFISLNGTIYSAITGIDINGDYSSADEIAYNTIYIYGNSTNNRNSYCFRRRVSQSYSGFRFNLFNNIFLNKRNTIQFDGKNYVIAIEDSRGLLQIGYNNYFAEGNLSFLGRWLNNDVSDINNWRLLVLADSTSISKNVEFVSNIDLHLTGNSLGDYDLIAKPISTINYDIDDEPRNVLFPYKGADENIHHVLPVDLISFKAEIIENSVILSWSTSSELNNRGFEIQRKVDSEDWEIIGFVPGFGSTNEFKSYNYKDGNLKGKVLIYRLKQIDYSGQFKFSDEVKIQVNILPDIFSLEQNYPNPFNSVTNIKYNLSSKSMVNLKIFNSIGECIVKLINDEEKPAGTYEIDFDTEKYGLSSGIYFYQFQAGDFIATKKMILLR